MRGLKKEQRLRKEAAPRSRTEAKKSGSTLEDRERLRIETEAVVRAIYRGRGSDKKVRP